MGFLSDLVGGVVSGVTGVVGGVLGAATNAVTGVLGAANPVLQTVAQSPALSAGLGAVLGAPPSVTGGLAAGGGKNNTQGNVGSGSDSVPWYKQTWFVVVSVSAGVLVVGGLLYSIFRGKRKRY